MAPRETENKAYAKFRGDEQRTLWCVMVFSGAVNLDPLPPWLTRKKHLSKERLLYVHSGIKLH